MASDADFVAYIADRAGLGPRLTHRRMFGEYALYVDGKVVALVCDHQLHIKPLAATAAWTASLPQRPPYPGAKLYPVADAWLDEADRLQALLLATAAAAPAPKKRAVKAAAKAAPKVRRRQSGDD